MLLGSRLERLWDLLWAMQLDFGLGDDVALVVGELVWLFVGEVVGLFVAELV